MRFILRHLWLDWSRAPISGTLQIAFIIAFLLWVNVDLNTALQFLILSHLVGIQRDPLNGKAD